MNEKCSALEACKYNAAELVTMRDVLREADMILGDVSTLCEQLRANQTGVLEHEYRVQAGRIIQRWHEYSERARKALSVKALKEKVVERDGRPHVR